MKLITHVLRVLLCFIPAFAAYAQKSEAPQISAMKVGDAWEWATLDPFSKLEQSKSTLSIMNIDGVLKRGTVGGNIKFARPLDKIISGEQKTSWGPWHVWPLEVGKKWRREHEWIRTDGVAGNSKQDAEVVAYEEITVSAGKFMAYKIEYRGHYTNYRGESGRQDDTYWYVPEVQSDVKAIQYLQGRPFRLQELVSYKRAAP